MSAAGESSDPEAVIEEPVEVDGDRLEVTRLESKRTGKVVYTVRGTFYVNGDRREKGMNAHHDGESWVLQYHAHGGNGFVPLARGDSPDDILSKAEWVMFAYDC